MSSSTAPLVTFVVPCYNSAAYMSRAVDSLLVTNHPIEILLINDGSKDDTGEIAQSYAQQYDCVRAIDQPNSNWGGVINHGIELARGTYFKVLDSDDYMEPAAFQQVLDTLTQLVKVDDAPDLLVTNYLYDHLPSDSERVMHYRKFFPQGHTFTWDEMIGQSKLEYMMIHAAWYATSILRDSGVHLPTGVSYMDSLLLLHPMPSVKKLYYLDIEPYCYVIGREGQTIDIEMIKAHIDEQLLASRLAIEDVDYAELYAREPQCAEFMAGYMLCMMSVSTLNLFRIGTPEALTKNDELWAFLKSRNPTLYGHVRHSWVGLINRRTKLGRSLALCGYSIIRKIYKIA